MKERDWTQPYSSEKILRLIKTKKDDFWSRVREKRPLKLFHEAAVRVPAYKDFLRKNRINPQKIKTWKDFQLVPPVSKKNYLKEYPLEKLSWDGTLKKPLVFTSTSGSTGEPFYFPRGEKLDWEYSVMIEMFLRNSSYGTEGPVLVIIGFGMGVWIGGLITYKAFEIAARQSKLSVSILTPGINKLEIFKALRRLAPHYKETILVGYGPFVKDIVDEAPGQGINLKRLNIRMLFAAEAFTEKFRDYITRKAAVKNIYRDTSNIYGTADIGAMAWETPTAILIRRLATENEQLFGSIFSQVTKTPTLAQYNPLLVTFEAEKGEIILTGDNTIPLVRYAVGDHGGILNFKEMMKELKKLKIDFKREAGRARVEDIYQLPFVYVYERSDLSTTLYGLQIYPETIREALIEKPLSKFLTGKFTMITKFDNNQNQYLEIHLELRKNRKTPPYLRKHTAGMIIYNLRSKNSEFRELHDYLKNRALPRLVFWPHSHPVHFKPGVKQKWVKK